MTIIKPILKAKTPAQIKLEALLAKARAQQAASSTEQIKAMLGEVQAKGVHDIDLSNITSKKATEAENVLIPLISGHVSGPSGLVEKIKIATS